MHIISNALSEENNRSWTREPPNEYFDHLKYFQIITGKWQKIPKYSKQSENILRIFYLYISIETIFSSNFQNEEP